MNILDYLPLENIYTDIAVSSKKEFFATAAARINENHAHFEPRALIDLFLKREQTLSLSLIHI